MSNYIIDFSSMNKKSTKTQNPKVDIDSWSSQAQKEWPTGKYRVQKDIFIKTEVEIFFSVWCDNIYIHEDDHSFVIYLGGRWQYPPPSTVYLDGQLLCGYHISTREYWDYLEIHHSQFKKACTYTKGETIYVFNGKHKDLPDLPSMNGYESFRKKLYSSGKLKAVVIISRNKYGEYIKNLTHSYNVPDLPLISTTVNGDNVEILLEFQKTEGIFHCFDIGYGGIPIICVQI